LDELGNYGIQHFAKHAKLDTADYEESKLIFTNNETLKFKEIYSLNIPAELVTLSACNTGIGRYHSGEGLMSLSRALVYAGARSVVHSLWRIPDEETAEIMGNFYAFLREGHTKSEALHKAKISFVKANPLKQHPYFWAGFILNGDNEPIKSSSPFPWSLISLLFLITAVVLYFSRKRLFALSRQTD
jgi:CHAT domain-containing protein